MKTVESIAELRREVAAARAVARSADGAGAGPAADPAAGPAIGFVPTMGALHEGHLSLIGRARARAPYVVVSIFVNPLQFGPGEDFDAYPRDLSRDTELAAGAGADLLFAPSVEEVYPSGELTVRVVPKKLVDRLCGLARPGHFEGVLTVVAKLFGMVEPDVAVFGGKDYQQSVLIRRMVADLNLDIAIDVAPVVREEDGLALSSRNRYLSSAERQRAVSLSQGLRSAVELFGEGVRDPERLKARVRGAMRSEAVEPEYIELVDPDTLDPLDDARPGAVMAVAARVGETRLIDNTILGE